MVVVGVMNQEEALKGVDWNTIGLLTGMMILVSISRRSGMFQYVAVWSAQGRQGASGRHPVPAADHHRGAVGLPRQRHDRAADRAGDARDHAESSRCRPIPILFAEIFASNIGGTATLIGDPPNILIGSQVGLDFNAFVIHLAPVIVVVMVVQAIMIHLVWGKDLQGHAGARGARHGDDAREDAITDWLLLKQSLVVLTVVMIAFVLARPLHLEPATIAMLGAAVLMLLDNWAHHTEKAAENIHKTFGDVEWITIFFFIGLFIVVHGVEVGGLLKLLADQLVAATGGDMAHAGYAILWASAVLSAIVDNIPFVATMIPLIKSMAPAYRRAGHDPAAVVVPVARRLPRRQRHADRRLGQPDGRGHRRAQRRAVPLRHLHALRLPDDAGVDRDQPRLRVVAIFLSGRSPVTAEAADTSRSPAGNASFPPIAHGRSAIRFTSRYRGSALNL